jgi:hypothetical protein
MVPPPAACLPRRTAAGGEGGASERPTEADSRLEIDVRFDKVKHSQRRAEPPYAVYEVVCREAGRAWRSHVRWSSLARMWDELMQFHRHELRRVRGGIPTFQRHTLRIGTFRVSPTLCGQRAEAMQRLLRTLSESTGASLVDGRGPRPLITFLSSGCNVELPTPSDRFFTVAGWPPHVTADGTPRHLAPRSLTPTATEAPELHPPLAEVLGEVRIEVLEAAGLPRADLLSQNDVYALLQLEGHVAQTLTLMDAAHPRWQCALRRTMLIFIVSNTVLLLNGACAPTRATAGQTMRAVQSSRSGLRIRALALRSSMQTSHQSMRMTR